MHVDSRSISIMRRRGEYWRGALHDASVGAVPPLLAMPLAENGPRDVLCRHGGVNQVPRSEAGAAHFMAFLSGSLQERAAQNGGLGASDMRVLNYVCGALERIERGGSQSEGGFARSFGLRRGGLEG